MSSYPQHAAAAKIGDCFVSDNRVLTCLKYSTWLDFPSLSLQFIFCHTVYGTLISWPDVKAMHIPHITCSVQVLD